MCPRLEEEQDQEVLESCQELDFTPVLARPHTKQLKQQQEDMEEPLEPEL